MGNYILIFLEEYNKYYICHASNLQIAFRADINGFDKINDALKFAEKYGLNIIGIDN